MTGIEGLELGRALFSALTAVSFGTVALVAAAWAVTVVLRPKRAALEHGVWAAALVGVVALPFALAWAATLPAPAMNLPGTAAVTAWATAVATATAAPAADAAAGPTSIARPSPASFDWRAWTGLLWLAVSALLLLRMGAQTVRVRRLLARARPIDTAAESLPLPLDVDSASLVQSKEVGSPAVFGLSRSVVVLPEGWHRWPKLKLRSVLLHELAHVARGDGRTVALSRLTTALLWFHPAAYWLRSKLRSTAERACDDHAVFVSGDRAGYAQALLEIASARAAANPEAALAMAGGSKAAARIDRILASSSERSGLLAAPTRRASAALAVCAAALLALAASATAQSGGVTLSGSVHDPSGARTPNAVIVLANEETGTVEATSSGADGSYRIGGLIPSDAYVIEVRGQGFAPLTQKLEIAGHTAFDPRLSIGPVEEEIHVSGTRQTATDGGSRTRTRIGGRVDRAKMTKYVEPVYPPAAEREGVEGTVLLQATISVEGVPTDVRTVNAQVDERLAQAARTAVAQWRYEPVKLNGEPVPIATVMSVAFQLP